MSNAPTPTIEPWTSAVACPSPSPRHGAAVASVVTGPPPCEARCRPVARPAAAPRWVVGPAVPAPVTAGLAVRLHRVRA